MLKNVFVISNVEKSNKMGSKATKVLDSDFFKFFYPFDESQQTGVNRSKGVSSLCMKFSCFCSKPLISLVMRVRSTEIEKRTPISLQVQ